MSLLVRGIEGATVAESDIKHSKFPGFAETATKIGDIAGTVGVVTLAATFLTVLDRRGNIAIQPLEHLSGNSELATGIS